MISSPTGTDDFTHRPRRARAARNQAELIGAGTSQDLVVAVPTAGENTAIAVRTSLDGGNTWNRAALD